MLNSFFEAIDLNRSPFPSPGALFPLVIISAVVMGCLCHLVDRDSLLNYQIRFGKNASNLAHLISMEIQMATT